MTNDAIGRAGRAAALALAVLATRAVAQMPHVHGAAADGRAATACTTTTLECANAVTPAFAADGTLWIAWTANGAVSVARSRDAGATFGAPVVLGTYGSMLDGGADARPQLAIGPGGRVVVAFGVFKDRRYNAQVMVSTSDDGMRFTTPATLSTDGASQRFPTIGFEPDGTLFAAWLDKRTVAAARAGGIEQPGAAVATATSRDGGTTFGPERVIADHGCECCHVDLAFDHGRPALLFRAIFGANIRDHAVTTLDARGQPGTPSRVAIDDWAIDGCPHHGPALAIAGDGSYQAAWFTQGRARQGLFLARSTDAGATFSPPVAIGDPARQPGRPRLFARGDRVWLAWKEFDGRTVTIKTKTSDDDGRTWGADRVVGTTGAYADHPLLVADANRVYVSWLTRERGYRLLPVGDR